MKILSVLLALSATVAAFEIEGGSDCILIEDSEDADDDHLFHYKQNDENLDPNKLYLLVHKIVFSKLDGVKKITLDYSKINVVNQHAIGEHYLTANVEQQKAGSVATHCYQLKYTVHDVDECTNTDKSKGMQWVSQCDSSASCENTIGSYNCVCSGDYFGTRNAGQGKCGGLLSTSDCCGESGECKADFVCHTDHCSGNKCHKDGYCIAGNSPNEYACACNDDYVGDGFTCEFVNYCKGSAEPKCPKGCSCVSHSDRDGFTCPPNPGYIDYTPPAHLWEHNPVVDPRRLDPSNHICVDDSIPTVVLIGSEHQILTQGDTYTEEGLLIEDDNTAVLKRTYTTDYSDAMHLMDPTGIKPCGHNEIVYQLTTPWLKTRPNITMSRTVDIVDVNECTYTGPVTEFHHACVTPAVCENKVCDQGDKQAYSCKCPYHGYIEDGHTHGCKDLREPVVRCVDFGCDDIVLWGLKMDAVIKQSKDGEPTLLASDNHIDQKWVHKQLESIYKDGVAVDAYDLLWDESIVDLTSEIQQHPLEIYDADKNIWALPFTVEDEVGNVGRFNVMIKVELVDAATLLSQFGACKPGTCHSPSAGSLIAGSYGSKPSASAKSTSSGYPEPQVSRFNISVHLFGMSVGLYLAWFFLYRAFRAVQCLVAPKTLMYQQKNFEQGMNFLLFIQSLGSLDEDERAKIIQSRWGELQS